VASRKKIKYQLAGLQLAYLKLCPFYLGLFAQAFQAILGCGSALDRTQGMVEVVVVV